jgi:hypothetical protein
LIDETKMIDILKQEVAKVGSQKAWALANGLSQAYVCDVLNGSRGVGDGIAKALGYEICRMFKKTKPTPAPVREHTPTLKILQGEPEDARARSVQGQMVAT